MKSGLKNLYITFVSFVVGVSGNFGNAQTETFVHTSAFDDHTCRSQDFLFNFTGIPSCLGCAMLCAHDEACRTIFFKENEGSCHGCTVTYSTTIVPLPSPGFQHFRKQACEVGWSAFQDSCYSLSPYGTFQDGVTYCQENSAHPVYVETSDENEFLKSFLTTDESHVIWYIGMTDSTQEGEWRYYGTNELVSFLDFHHSQPDDDVHNSQQCAIYVGGYGLNYTWADHYCSDGFPTICEKSR